MSNTVGREHPFSSKTKMTIAQRAGYLCSHPECGMATIGPAEDDNRVVNGGSACHIIAASENGPRGDSSMTHAERTHSNNGIWMCRTHGKLIDDDLVLYTADLLRAWKKQAEDRCRNRVGRAPTVDGSPSHAHVSTVDRIGPDSRAVLEDGTEILLAKTYSHDRTDMDMFYLPRLTFRVLVQKSATASSIMLYAIQAVVFKFDPLPKYQPSFGVYPTTVFPYLIDLEKPIDDQPRTCRANLFWPSGESAPVPFTPLIIPDEEPQVIDLRIGAVTSGIFMFALDFVVASGVERQTLRVMKPTSVLFEKMEELWPD